MYSDPRGVRRPVKDRLGASFVRSSPSVLVQQAILKRQHQDSDKWSNAFHGEKNQVVKDDVSKDLTASQLQKDVFRSSKNSISSVTGVQEIALKNAHTPVNVCSAESKGRSATQMLSAKKPAVQSASAPTSGEKKHVEAGKLTVATFLQRLGLSKYLISFQAEEVDMFALKHMNDDDLKSIGLPMGPRKKILYALVSVKAKK